MADYSTIQKLDDEIKRRRRADPAADVSGLLEEALNGARERDERLYILSRLASEYQLVGKFSEAEVAIRKQIELDPEKPEAWLELAGHYYRYARDLAKALSTIETAVRSALREGNFVRQAYSERIRIALDAKDYRLVEDSLCKLVEYAPRQGSIDVELEKDFLPRIPAGSVKSDLLERYRRHAIR